MNVIQVFLQQRLIREEGFKVLKQKGWKREIYTNPSFFPAS
jgi:hypothetical protein